MSRFSWLLISDLHLKAGDKTWNQKVVLRDMVRDIEEKAKEFTDIKFVIVSGDLAHGGDPKQYVLVEQFLTDLLNILGLDKSALFLVAGNHDIDRNISELAFHGSRSEFTSAENVERYLSTESERNTLLKRLEAYRNLESKFVDETHRTTTDDGLAYLEERCIDEFPIGIVGLNSGLACGNDEDEAQIIIGDRPIIEACELIRKSDSRLIIGVMHHPPFFLRPFDKKTFDQRFLPCCDILHRGHLHEQEVKLLYTSGATTCLSIAAGAGYVWRQFANSYSIVTFDTAKATCEANYFEYNSHSGDFDLKQTEIQPVPLRGEIPGSVSELCDEISKISEPAKELAPLLATILTGYSSDVPVSISGRVLFAGQNLVETSEASDYKQQLMAFLNVRNSLLAFADAVTLADRVQACSEPVRVFAEGLNSLRGKDDTFDKDLAARVATAHEICNPTGAERSSTYVDTLRQFAAEADWEGLAAMSRRYFAVDSDVVQHSARQHLCLALANANADSHPEAIEIAQQLVGEATAGEDDYQIAFSVYRRIGRPDDACATIESALDRFGEISEGFKREAIRFAGETGNRELRDLISEGN